MDEFCPQGDEKGVGQREPKKQAGAWRWKVQGGRMEDAMWTVLYRNESTDVHCLAVLCGWLVVGDDEWKMASGKLERNAEMGT